MTDSFTGRPCSARLPDAFLAALRERIDPEQIDDAGWYGGGSLSGILGPRLTELVETSAAMFPAGRPAAGSVKAPVWNDAMRAVGKSLLDEYEALRAQWRELQAL